MSPGPSLDAFKLSISRAGHLLSLERATYKDPPPLDARHAVDGLRSGASILMVAAFEAYLRDRLAEFVSDIGAAGYPIDFAKLPTEIQVANTFNALQSALRGTRHGPAPPKPDRLPGIKLASWHVHSNLLVPGAFGDTRSNPGKENLKAIFKEAAIPDVFTQVQPRFTKRWKQPVAHTFIADTLEGVVNRRHLAAHGGVGLSFSRKDLRDSLRFLTILAEVFDIELRAHARSLRKAARAA